MLQGDCQGDVPENGDAELLQQRIPSTAQDLTAASSSSSSSPDADRLPTITHRPSRASSILGKRKAAAPGTVPEYQKTAVGLLKDIVDQRRKEESPHFSFAMALIDDMKLIKCPRRLCILKHSLYNLVHEAIMAEMPDSCHEGCH